MREIEALTVDAVASEAADTGAHVGHTHATCLNCGAHLHGRYCHACGQSNDDHHRSIGHLLWEAVEGFTHLDGRLRQTLPALLFRPGRLARDHIEGRRQRHVPPFRLFLITLLVFMFCAELSLNAGRDVRQETGANTHSVNHVNVGGLKVEIVPIQDAKSALDQATPQDSFGRWLHDHAVRAAQNRDYYVMLMFDWAHRLAVLMLPILAGLLTLFYFYKKQFYVYDHLVVAMQYLSFCFLIWSPIWLAPKWLSDWLFPVALIWTPLNLYLILRTAYGSSRVGAGAKAIVLWSSTVVGFSVLLTALLVWGLNKM